VEPDSRSQESQAVEAGVSQGCPGFAAALVALCLVSLVSCRSEATGGGGATISLDISPNAVVGQPAVVTVVASDASGAPITDARVEVEGNMRHAGMAPVIAQAAEVSAGRYAASDFVFTMGGDWVVTARVVLPDGTKVEKSIEVPGVSATRGSAR